MISESLITTLNNLSWPAAFLLSCGVFAVAAVAIVFICVVLKIG
jgi:hypothetical protein